MVSVDRGEAAPKRRGVLPIRECDRGIPRRKGWYHPVLYRGRSTRFGSVPVLRAGMTTLSAPCRAVLQAWIGCRDTPRPLARTSGARKRRQTANRPWTHGGTLFLGPDAIATVHVPGTGPPCTIYRRTAHGRDAVRRRLELAALALFPGAIVRDLRGRGHGTTLSDNSTEGDVCPS